MRSLWWGEERGLHERSAQVVLAFILLKPQNCKRKGLGAALLEDQGQATGGRTRRGVEARLLMTI
jgi:hypothetical protein